MPWSGVMQSVGIEELHEREGVLIEATGSPPGMGAISAPGYGTHLLRRLDRAVNRAMLGAMIADEPSGRVFGGRTPIVSYKLAKRDERRLSVAIDAMAKVMLAAGAKEVELGDGIPAVRSEAELEAAMQRLDSAACASPASTPPAASPPAQTPLVTRSTPKAACAALTASG